MQPNPARLVAGANELFRKVATRVSCLLGSPVTFIAAAFLVVVWAACGPYFGFSDAWQLVINTSTTIGTFLMLFVLQNSQNRDTKAINIKLDELLRAIEGARNRLTDLGDASDEELDKLEREFRRLAETGRRSEAPRSDAGALKRRKGKASHRRRSALKAPAR